MDRPAGNNHNSKDILRALMDPSRPDPVPWSSHELRAILEHQLASPLDSEAERLAQISGLTVKMVAALLRNTSCVSFGELLMLSPPHLRALKLVKEFFKASLAKDGDLPRDVARCLYVVAILQGQRAGIGQISSLDETSLEREARRCLTFGWLPQEARQLIQRAIEDPT